MTTHVPTQRPRPTDPRLLAAGIVLACLVLAALSLMRPSAPTTDPWGWIVWGREVLHLGLDTTAGTPAWKPLPVLVTTPLALFGPAAPALWLVFARTAGLLALVLAFRAARRVAGTGAGVAAALFVLLIGGFVRELEHGYTEPLLAALALTAVERHSTGHRIHALALGALVCLGRPEAFAFLVPYAVLTWRARPRRRWQVTALVAAVPALWLGGDWWGAGDPLHAGHVAAGAGSQLGAGDMLMAAAQLAGPVLLVPAVWALWCHRRDFRMRLLAGAAAGWMAMLALLVGFGYPSSDRFMVLPAVVVCVLAGVGVADLAQLRLGPVVARVAAGAAALALVALYVPAQLLPLPGRIHRAEAESRSQAHLRDVVRTSDRVPGPECGHPMLPATLDWDAGAVAWELGVPLERVDTAVGAARMLASRRPLIGLAVHTRGNHTETLLGLQASARTGADLYLPRPVSRARVDSGQGLRSWIDAGDGHWGEIAVCPPNRRPHGQLARRGA